MLRTHRGQFKKIALPAVALGLVLFSLFLTFSQVRAA